MLTAFSPQPSSARCRRRRLGAERWVLRCWQAKRDLNPQPAVLETAALPVELLACKCRKSLQKQAQSDFISTPDGECASDRDGRTSSVPASPSWSSCSSSW